MAGEPVGVAAVPEPRPIYVRPRWPSAAARPWYRPHPWLVVAVLAGALNLGYFALPAPLAFPQEMDVRNGRTESELARGAGEPRARTGDDLRLVYEVCNRYPWPVTYTSTRTLRAEVDAGGRYLVIPRPDGPAQVAPPGCTTREVVLPALFEGVSAGRWRLTGVASVPGVVGRVYQVEWQTKVVIVAARQSGGTP